MRGWTALMAIQVAGALCACGSPNLADHPNPAEQPSEPGFRLEVNGTIERGNATLPFVTTREWESGDAISLTVRASRNIFLTVAYCDSGERMSVYPEDGALVVPPAQDLRIPSTGVFRVDAKRGVESLYVIGSVSPLESGDPNLAAQLRQEGAAEIGAPCAVALEQTTEESLAARSAPPAAASGSPASTVKAEPQAPIAMAQAVQAEPSAAAPAPRRRKKPLELQPEWLPRGLYVEESAPTSSSVARSDRFGTAILAFRRNHIR